MAQIEGKLQFYGFTSQIPDGKNIRDVIEDIAQHPGVRFVAQFSGEFLIFCAVEHETLEGLQQAVADPYWDAGLRTEWSTMVKSSRVKAPKRGSPPYCAIVRAQVRQQHDPDDVLESLDQRFEEREQQDPEHFSYGAAVVTGDHFDLLVDFGGDSVADLTGLIRELRSVDGVGRTSSSFSYLPNNAIPPVEPQPTA